MSINTTTIGGRLCRDVETKFLPKGTAIANVSVANNRKWKNEAGETKEEVSFFDVVMFGSAAENFAKYHAKGSECLVEGRLKQETWDDKATGQKRSKIVVVADRWHFVGGKKDDAPKTDAPQKKIPTAGHDTLNGEKPPTDDDVPF